MGRENTVHDEENTLEPRPSRLSLRWLMLGVPVLIVVGASVWAIVSVMLEAAAGSQPGDFFFAIREQALQVQLSLATDPERRADIVLQMSATPLSSFGSNVVMGDEPESIAPSTVDDRADYDRPATLAPTVVEVSHTPEPLEPSQTPTQEPGSNSGPSPSNTLEPTRTLEATREPSSTVEPTRTVEPARTQEPSRTTEPTRTAEPSRTAQPTQTASSPSGSGSGGPGPGPATGPTETPRPEDVTIQGTLESTGGSWVVAGQSFQVDGGTEIRGDPQVGSTVEVRALRYWDGTVIAYRIEKK